jgi:DNA modification methylase
MNTLYYGDNLDIMREYIPDESVDLVYLDPPFNSKQAYNVIFRDKEGHYPPSLTTIQTQSVQRAVAGARWETRADKAVAWVGGECYI